MNILITRNIPEAGIQLMQQAGHTVHTWSADRPMTRSELTNLAQRNDALVTMLSDSIDKAFLNSCSHLRVIAQYAVGYDNIDVQEASRLQIPIGNTPDVLSEATADVAFTLLLMVARKALFMHKTISKGQWDFFRPTAHLGVELKNKTLGILGLGRIGMEMARRCLGAYRMNLLYHNRQRNIRAEQELNATYVPFDELIQTSDIISVHCALNKSTAGLFSRKVFEEMKPTAIFINTARGAVHDEQALLDALQNGRIWGAGLDVTNPEPMASGNPLLDMPNVAILPHIGSATEEARLAMSVLSAENIIAGLKGEQLPYAVNHKSKS